MLGYTIGVTTQELAISTMVNCLESCPTSTAQEITRLFDESNSQGMPRSLAGVAAVPTGGNRARCRKARHDLAGFVVPHQVDDRPLDGRRVQAPLRCRRAPQVVDDLGQVADRVRGVGRRGEVI